MSRTLMSPRKRQADRPRLDMRIDPEMGEWATARANQLGMNISAFIRMLIQQERERIEGIKSPTSEEPKDKRGRKR